MRNDDENTVEIDGVTFEDDIDKDVEAAAALEESLERALAGRDRRLHRRAGFVPNRAHKRSEAEVRASLAEAQDGADGPEFSYQASRHERVWILSALEPMFYQGVITDVLRLAKGGKEASVYVCAASAGLGVPYLAAKIYRPRRFRNLRNDARYRIGREARDGDGKLVKDSRALHAMQAGTGKGKEMSHTSWLAHEYLTLQRLYEAGLDVPRPFLSGDNVILMEYIGEGDQPAPTLNHVTLGPAEAGRMFERVLWNIEGMLAERRVHGDLSAYNLLHEPSRPAGLRIIDFPQAVDPFQNPEGRSIFDRDVTRVCEYFAGYGTVPEPGALAEALWLRQVPPDLWELVPPVPEED
jgi:RIO kinase 1